MKQEVTSGLASFSRLCVLGCEYIYLRPHSSWLPPEEALQGEVCQPEEGEGDEGPVVQEGEHQGVDRDPEEGRGEEAGQEGEEEGGGGGQGGQGGGQVAQEGVQVQVVPGLVLSSVVLVCLLTWP